MWRPKYKTTWGQCINWTNVWSDNVYVSGVWWNVAENDVNYIEEECPFTVLTLWTI